MDDKKRIHAVGWATITKSKLLGGLGLKRLDVMNRAYIMKLSWMIINNADDLWCKVMQGRYKFGEMHENSCTKAQTQVYGKILQNLLFML